MKKYTITQPISGIATFTVLAESAEEAINAVKFDLSDDIVIGEERDINYESGLEIENVEEIDD